MVFRNFSYVLLLVTAVTTLTAQTTGLWIGRAAIGAVSYPASSVSPEEPIPTDTEAVLRLILHVDAEGQARILQRVIQSVEDGEVLLYPDESLVRADLSTDLRRVSSVAFPVMNPLRSTLGSFNVPEDPLFFEVEVGYDDPTNPFKHAFHPDHNNLDSRYENLLGAGSESFTVSRDITLTFFDLEAPPAAVANDPEWGSSLVGGTYSERITGLYRQVINDVTIEDIVVEGEFLLRRMSDIDVLTDLGEIIPDEKLSTYTQGLATYFPFDETSGLSAVESVYEFEAELVNMNEDDSWGTGQVGGAVYFPENFDSQDSFQIEVDNSFRFQVTGDQTIEMWIYPQSLEDESSRTQQTVLGKAWGGEFTLVLEEDLSLSYYYGISGDNSSDGEHQVVQSPVLPIDQWTHVAAVRDFSNGELIWYFNGVPQSSTPLDFSFAAASENNLTIGAGVFGGSFVGAIDELRIWNLPRTAGELLSTINLTIEEATDYEPITGYPEGLVAYYPMEEGSGSSLTDVVNANDGDLVNMASSASWVDGMIGGALTFDGVDDYVNLGNPVDLQIAGDLTVEAWVRIQDDATANMIFAKAYGGEYYIFSRKDNHRVFCYYGETGTNSGTFGSVRSRFYSEANTTVLGEWVHIAVVRDITNGTASIYANGELVSTTLDYPEIGVVSGNDSVGIGASIRASGTVLHFFTGEIDELRVWNIARTQSEILSTMNAAIEPIE